MQWQTGESWRRHLSEWTRGQCHRQDARERGPFIAAHHVRAKRAYTGCQLMARQDGCRGVYMCSALQLRRALAWQQQPQWQRPRLDVKLHAFVLELLSMLSWRQLPCRGGHAVRHVLRGGQACTLCMHELMVGRLGGARTAAVAGAGASGCVAHGLSSSAQPRALWRLRGDGSGVLAAGRDSSDA
jgi:hypothetical protein